MLHAVPPHATLAALALRHLHSPAQTHFPRHLCALPPPPPTLHALHTPPTSPATGSPAPLACRPAATPACSARPRASPWLARTRCPGPTAASCWRLSSRRTPTIFQARGRGGGAPCQPAGRPHPAPPPPQRVPGWCPRRWVPAPPPPASAGVVARFFYTPTSHPAVKQSLNGLVPRRVMRGGCWGGAGGAGNAVSWRGRRLTDRRCAAHRSPCASLACRRLSLGALTVQNLVNRRGERAQQRCRGGGAREGGGAAGAPSAVVSGAAGPAVELGD